MNELERDLSNYFEQIAKNNCWKPLKGNKFSNFDNVLALLTFKAIISVGAEESDKNDEFLLELQLRPLLCQETQRFKCYDVFGLTFVPIGKRNSEGVKPFMSGNCLEHDGYVMSYKKYGSTHIPYRENLRFFEILNPCDLEDFFRRYDRISKIYRSEQVFNL